MRSAYAGLLVLATMACREPTLVPPPPLPDLEVPPITVQTTAPAEVVAGEVLAVGCSVEDPGGGTLEPGMPEVRVIPETSVRLEDGRIEAVRVGHIEVACAYPDIDVVDLVPVLTRIVPGPPTQLTIDVDAPMVEAGGRLNATCTATDLHGNATQAADAALELLPSDPLNPIVGRQATLLRSGRYDASCALPGATSTNRRIEVVPAVPAELLVSRVPDLPVYGTSQTITLSSRVVDAFGNVVLEVQPVLDSVPRGTPFGPDAVRFEEDGDYTLTVTVPPPTASGTALVHTEEVTVNGAGPAIRCDSPIDGRMITASPGSTLTFTGGVADANAIAGVQVNGQTVAVAPDGRFQTGVPVVLGQNFVDIVAIDGFGIESTRVCTFLAAPAWFPEEGLADDVVSLTLFQSAIDDGNPQGALNSLNDLLTAVTDSPGLLDTLDNALSTNNPLKNSCDQSVFGVCIFRSRIDYRDASIGGPNETSLTLVDGGLDARVVVRDVAIDVRLTGTIDSDVTARFDSVNIDLGFDLVLDGSGPGVVVRSTQVDVSGLDADLSGFPGFLEDILLFIFGVLINDLVEDVLRDQIRDEFGAILDDLVGGLDITSLATVVEVPRLDGNGTLPLSFGLGFSSLDVTPSRLQFGVATQLTGPSAIANPSFGVAVESDAFLSTIATSRSAAAGIHQVLFNQALHALWRGGLFDAELVANDLGGELPDGLSARLRATLPPVAELDGQQVKLGLGPLVIDLTYPGLFDEPLSLVIGARSTLQVGLVDGDLAFGQLAVDEVFLSTPGVPLDPTTRLVLEGFAGALVQRIVDGALNDAIPALPIPSFPLPDDVVSFGLPAGSELGIRNPVLTTTPPHFVLTGGFGVLP
ncbi:MAG: hypothetical protein AAGA48_36860 [Myxococcota bacterium]